MALVRKHLCSKHFTIVLLMVKMDEDKTIKRMPS